MSSPAARARRATLADRAVVVDILVSAFQHDPTWSWAFPDESTRPAQLRRLWDLFVPGALRYPWVWLSSGDMAAAVWLPPGGTELPADQAARLPEIISDLFGPDADRVAGALAAFDDARHQAEAPHFYLGMLGTRADHWGHGYGLALLADNLRHVDAEGMPAYLEATNTVNVELYERHGFAVVGVVTPPGGAPAVTTMWREPRSTASAG